MKSLSQMQFSSMNEKEIKELIEKFDLINSMEVAVILGWSIGKVSVYAQRGKLPDPIAYIGGRPIWARSQIEKFIKEGGLK